MANDYINKVVLSDGTTLIDLTSDDVLAEHVQAGIKFHDKTGKPTEGTNTKTVDASEATATAAEVLDTKTFGKGSEVLTGTMPNNSGKNVELKEKTEITIPKGYYDGSSVAKLSAEELEKLIAENIKEGVTILGVEGSFGADDISSQHKVATPHFGEEPQIIKPDPGISYLTYVEIEPIKVERVDNDFGGVTVTIG